jgi:hypothetical protein
MLAAHGKYEILDALTRCQPSSSGFLPKMWT